MSQHAALATPTYTSCIQRLAAVKDKLPSNVRVLAFDKHHAKAYAELLHVRVPANLVKDKDFVVKPPHDFSAKGVTLVRDGKVIMGEPKRVPIVEELIVDENDQCPPRDFKLCVFNGQVKLVHVYDRQAKRLANYLPADWTPVKDLTRIFWTDQPRPACWDKMQEDALKLAEPFMWPVRVDFYATKTGPVFGEFCLTSGIYSSLTAEGELLMGGWWREHFAAKGLADGDEFDPLKFLAGFAPVVPAAEPGKGEAEVRFSDPKFIGTFHTLADPSIGPALTGRYVNGRPVITHVDGEPVSTLPTTADARYETTPLARVVRDLAYKVGDFTLASGAKSNEYVNVKNALLHPHARRRIAEAVERMIKSTAGLRYATCVAGPELGAVPLAVAVSDAAARMGHSMPTLMVRKKSKEHGTKALVDGLDLVAPGAPVVLVEDVFTTGNSSASALEALLAAGLNPVGAVCVVDREQGANTLIGGTYGIPVCRLMTIEEVRQARHDCMEYRPVFSHANEFACPVCMRKWRQGSDSADWVEVYLHDATQLGLPGTT